MIYVVLSGFVKNAKALLWIQALGAGVVITLELTHIISNSAGQALLAALGVTGTATGIVAQPPQAAQAIHAENA